MKERTNLQEHQKVLFELLEQVDTMCRQHNINYMLFAGSALGAVRHKNIIPWDDDLDIVMLRKDYDKFLKVAPTVLNKEKYFLQREFSEHWPMFFSKLRKNNTACLERFIPKDEKMHQGIYIDIFPCDNLTDNKLVRKVQFYASKIVIAKSLSQRGYLTDSIFKKFVMAVSSMVPTKLLSRFVQQKGKTNTKFVHTFFGAASKYEKNIFPREWITKKILMQFGDKEYPVSLFYDELLTKLYGSYMIPPNKYEISAKIHAELVDVNNSYDKYLDIQKSMKFDTYTRSIR